MASTRQPSLSVMVQRSRIHGNRAYVRIGVVNAGFRDLDTGAVHCEDEQHLAAVARATAPIPFSFTDFAAASQPAAQAAPQPRLSHPVPQPVPAVSVEHPGGVLVAV